MRLIYTDENYKLKVFGELVNSQEFVSFVQQNIKSMQEYSYGSKRNEAHLARQELNKFLKQHGLFISTEVKHAHGIGNNNSYCVQDLESQEYIGRMNLNTDMHGGMYCYATDINNLVVSNTYFLGQNFIKLDKTCNADWSKYAFAQEERALELIEEAIALGILQRGENGGVMVCKTFHGFEAWEEDTKEDAAKDLVSSGNVQMLSNAINDKKENNRRLEEVFERYNTSYLMSEYCNYVCHLESKEFFDNTVVVHLKDDMDGSMWSHIVSVDENDELQIKTEFGISIYDYAEESGWTEEDIYKIKHGHVPFREPEKGVLLEYKGVLFDDWSVERDNAGNETGSIWGEMCACCAEKHKDVLKTELAEDGAVGACSVQGCFHRGDDEASPGNYYVDFKPQLVKFIDLREKILGEEKGAAEVESMLLDELLQGVKERIKISEKSITFKDFERE